MRRLAMLGVVAAIWLAGCGKPREQVVLQTPDGTVTASSDGATTTVKGPNGEYTSTQNGQQMKITGSDGKGGTSTIESGKPVDMTVFGVAAYPGATPSGSGAMNATADGKQIHSATVETVDAPAKVMEFYGKEVKGATTLSSPEGGTIIGKNTAGDDISIIVSADKSSGKSTVSFTTQHQEAK